MNRHKFKAKQTIRDGIKFPSKLEALHYDYYKLLEKSGDVLFFLRQTPFHLPGGVTYRVDYQIFWSDGNVQFVDAKGIETQAFIDKKKMVESLYPVEICVSKKAGSV